ncbi:unnamed protein product [Dracunculus medinensis]|uniref:Solute carrier family 25 member 46 n=1 Tax=Dracunculus medinensis TaxID=318479 RepID=A0A0N4UQL8_DRAME|nr:unnamed protein product [Dracunculus medinensis]
MSRAPELLRNFPESNHFPSPSLVDNLILITKLLITHPCTVLRRQCQVHQFARSLHVTPFTLVPVVCNMVAAEGLLSLWKGALGSNVLWALSIVSEILLADILGLPRSFVKRGSTEKFWRHIALKAYVFGSFFYLLNNFCSETGLALEDIKVMDVITNGINRLHFDFFGPRDNSKRFALIYLAIPTTIYQTTHYLIAVNFYDWIFTTAQRYVNKKSASEKTVFHSYLPQFFATMTSQVMADLISYPVETILHRLYIQGTRTLIDNLDNGVSAISITAKYTGFFDCLRSILHREGFITFYSGVGALALQYALHFCFLRLVRTLFEYASGALSNINRGSSNARQRLPSSGYGFGIEEDGFSKEPMVPGKIVTGIRSSP